MISDQMGQSPSSNYVDYFSEATPSSRAQISVAIGWVLQSEENDTAKHGQNAFECQL